jgi:glycosidase
LRSGKPQNNAEAEFTPSQSSSADKTSQTKHEESFLMGKSASEQITLNTTGGDAWAWEKKITGRCACEGKCTTISVKVNGREVKVERKGSEFSARVPLAEGKNRILAACQHSNGKQCASKEVVFNQCLEDRPKAEIRLSIDSEGISLEGGKSQPSELSGAPIVKYIWSAHKENPSPVPINYSLGPASDASILLNPPRVDGEYYFSLKVVDANSKSDTAEIYFVVEDGKPRKVNLAAENPAWVENTVIYGVVPHNFGPRGFRSVIEKLDYLKSLGVNAIWLSPCNVTPTGRHGYAVSDYFNLRKDYGTKAEFKKLVQEAHARGIRVLMDFVPNHSSIHHPYMEHAKAHGKASPYYDFYDRDGHDGLHTFYFYWVYLPNLNYENPEVRRWMTEAFSYWVREFDVDGFRVDVAWGIRQRRPDYWPQWRKELQQIKPDLLLLAEASARDPYYFTEGFDAAYDWTDNLGQWTMEKVFEDDRRIALRLHSALTNDGKGYHEDALIFRFLNNNDTAERFITRYGLKKERVAAALLLTLPGIPCVYTGQEVGEEFEPYKLMDPISWKDKHGLRNYYKKLIGLRRKTACLHSRKWEILHVRSMLQGYAYLRYAGPNDPPALVVLNFTDHKGPVEIVVPKRIAERLSGFAAGCQVKDVLRGERVKIAKGREGDLRIEMPASSARILMQEKSEKTARKKK